MNYRYSKYVHNIHEVTYRQTVRQTNRQTASTVTPCAAHAHRGLISIHTGHFMQMLILDVYIIHMKLKVSQAHCFIEHS